MGADSPPPTIQDDRSAKAHFVPSRTECSRLSPPLQLTDQVERTLVLRSLDIARTGRLTQVVGPPGSGKTVALTQWHDSLRGRGVKVAWYTASEREREPPAFLLMLAHAMHRVGLSMLETGIFDTRDLEARAALDAILLKLDVSGTETVLIIDAFDRADGPRLAPCLEQLVMAAPDTTHIVLATRRRPQLTMAVLRAHGYVRTIESRELRLSLGEIAELLRLPEDSPDVATIAQHTGGWAVAVELYRVWRARTGRSSALTPLFASEVSEITDYLTEQVFATLEPPHQRLLVELSLFDTITPQIADWVRRAADSTPLLDTLCGALPGLVERGTSELEPSYHVHPLLADYARARLQLSPMDRVALHRRAAFWFASRQRHVEAVSHARATDDAEFVTGVLSALRPCHILLAWGAGELRAILRALTPDHIAAHPRLQLMAALAHFKAGFFLEANEMLAAVKAATRGFAADPYGNDRLLQIEGRFLELYFAVHISDPESPINVADCVAAIRKLAYDDPLMWAATESVTIVFSEQTGELQAARGAIQRTRSIYQTHGTIHYADAFLLAHEVLLSLAQGTLSGAAELAVTMRRRHLAGVSGDVPMLAMSRIADAVAEYERKYKEGAAEIVRQALDQFGESEIWFEPHALCYCVLADVAYRRGGAASLRDCVANARTRVRGTGLKGAEIFLAALEAGYLIRAGQLALARQLIESVMRRREALRMGAVSAWRERDTVATALALWYIAVRETAAAAEIARTLIDDGSRGGRQRSAIKGHLLLALAQEQAANSAAATAAIEAALVLAVSEEHVAVFVEEGAAVAGVLERAVGSVHASPAVRRHAENVLRTLKLSRRGQNALNEREAQVVALLAAGASNKLIGRKLGLSENTIKFHLKKIFAKLGVTSRKAVVAALSNHPQ